MIELSNYTNRPLVYVSGPFRATTEQGVLSNIDHATEFSKRLWNNGFSVICPHANTSFLSETTEEIHRTCIEGDFRMMLGCDAIMLIGDWEKSEGAKEEFRYALRLKMPVFDMSGTKVLAFDYSEEFCRFVDLDCQEGNELSAIKNYICQYPQQFLAFRELSAYGYYLMVRKNKDYSPSNIKGTGKVGIATRLWDKCARYLNLVGFDLETGELGVPKKPNNESIEDNLLDLSNYGHIGNIFAAKKWGK